MSTDRKSKDELLVRDILNSLGLRASFVPEATKQRCDLVAFDDHWQYLVEVKQRTDPEQYLKALESNEVVPWSRSSYYCPAISRTIDRAMKQLSATMKVADAHFLLLGFVAGGSFDRRTTLQQLHGTVFGARAVVDFGDDASTSKDCLYAAPSAFKKHRGLTAVMAFEGHSRMHLLLNPFCASMDSFRKCRLYLAARSWNAVFDPVEQERAGNVYVVHADLDLRDEPCVEAYLARKYSLSMPKIMEPEEITGSALVPRSI